MVLAGLRPEVVMDVATRAIMFWSYQQHQEQLHQTMVSKSLKDFISQLKADSEVEVGFLKSEIQTLKRKQEGELRLFGKTLHSFIVCYCYSSCYSMNTYKLPKAITQSHGFSI